MIVLGYSKHLAANDTVFLKRGILPVDEPVYGLMGQNGLNHGSGARFSEIGCIGFGLPSFHPFSLFLSLSLFLFSPVSRVCSECGGGCPTVMTCMPEKKSSGCASDQRTLLKANLFNPLFASCRCHSFLCSSCSVLILSPSLWLLLLFFLYISAPFRP